MRGIPFVCVLCVLCVCACVGVLCVAMEGRAKGNDIPGTNIHTLTLTHTYTYKTCTCTHTLTHSHSSYFDTL